MIEEDRCCSRCGALLEMKSIQGVSRPYCTACGKIIYYDPKLATTTVLEQEGRILMVRRLTPPGVGRWSLPGGYVDRGEMVERAAAREVFEETGLQVDIMGLVGLFSQDNDPIALAAFNGRVIGGQPAAGPEVSAVGFFSLDELPPLAFARDTRILEAWKRFKNSGGQARL